LEIVVGPPDIEMHGLAFDIAERAQLLMEDAPVILFVVLTGCGSVEDADPRKLPGLLR
jgi:hypothetical protein